MNLTKDLRRLRTLNNMIIKQDDKVARNYLMKQYNQILIKPEIQTYLRAKNEKLRSK